MRLPVALIQTVLDTTNVIAVLVGPPARMMIIVLMGIKSVILVTVIRSAAVTVNAMVMIADMVIIAGNHVPVTITVPQDMTARVMNVGKYVPVGTVIAMMASSVILLLLLILVLGLALQAAPIVRGGTNVTLQLQSVTRLFFGIKRRT